jgi:diguanylate cyclase (GGDEF)-like protein
MVAYMSTDHLTGFFSRESLNRFLQENMLEAASERKSLFLTLVDLDHFKSFNDKFGHVFGDEILKYAAEVLRSTMGETSNYFFRYGGDEFIIVSIDKKLSEIARSIKAYNTKTYYQPFLAKHRSYRLTLSAGIAIFPRDAQTVDDLIKKADKAMYFSKRHGRSRVTLAGMTKMILIGDIFKILVVGVASLIVSSYFTHNPDMVGVAASSIMKNVRRIKIVSMVRGIKIGFTPKTSAEPDKPGRASGQFDVVKLRDGRTYEGRILVDSPDEVIISVKSEKGESMLSFPASKIDSIRRGIRMIAGDTSGTKNDKGGTGGLDGRLR